MNKTMKIILAVVAVAVVAGGAVIFTNKKDTQSTSEAPASTTPAGSKPTSTQDQTSTAPAPSSNANNSVAAVITYMGDGFELSATTVKVGSTIKITNSSASKLEFDSDPHPVHTDEKEFNLGSLAPGESKTFTVTKKGTWGFHNHLNASQHAKITVE